MIGWWTVALAAAAAQPDAACASAGACRYVDEVRVQQPDGRPSTHPVKQTLPWIANENLLLFPGDWAIVRLEPTDARLVPSLIAAGTGGTVPEPEEGQVRIKVHPFEAGTLIIEAISKRHETLDYAALVVVDKAGPQRTSVCSLQPGVTSFETWRWPIHQIALWGFRPAAKPGCRTVDMPDPAAARDTGK